MVDMRIIRFWTWDPKSSSVNNSLCVLLLCVSFLIIYMLMSSSQHPISSGLHLRSICRHSFRLSVWATALPPGRDFAEVCHPLRRVQAPWALAHGPLTCTSSDRWLHRLVNIFYPINSSAINAVTVIVTVLI